MASIEVAGIGPPTGSGVVVLSGTTADTVTVSPLSRWWLVEVVNVGSSNIDFRCDGTTAQAGQPGTVRVAPGGSVSFRSYAAVNGRVSVVGDDGSYAVNVIPI